jgi:methyl-accepting chemotaxis protein
VFLAIFILAVLSIIHMKNTGLETAELVIKRTLQGNQYTFNYMIMQEYGDLNIVDGHLVDENGGLLDNRYGMIDKISADLDIVATIFMRENDDYRRITTSVLDSDGKRAIGTMLDKTSPAYAFINKGESYIGNATILGEEYIASYVPFFAPHTKDVIGILFVGERMTEVHNMITEKINRNILIIVLISIVILAAAVALNIFVFSKVIIGPIKKIIAKLQVVGEGDLTQQINLTAKNELGEMAHYFDTTVQSLKNLVSVIKIEAAELNNIGTDLVSNMTETASAINEITATIQSLKGRVLNQSASVTETNATMLQISDNIDKLNGQVEQQTESVNQSSSAIEQMLANIQSVTQTLIKNADNVSSLANASGVGKTGLQKVAADIQEIASESEGLLEINAVMQNIASQTNLLAMNASIEAAHAGEAGKGFSVVADEIRKLAENSGKQSKTISSVLKKIKDSIDTITKSTQTVLEKFESIDTGVRVVSDQEGNIRNAMEEQGVGSKQILEAVSRLNDITQLVKAGSEEMLEGSKEIIVEGKNLEVVTSEITNGMNEISLAAGQINQSVTHVNGISDNNKKNIAALVSAVEKFKVE